MKYIFITLVSLFMLTVSIIITAIISFFSSISFLWSFNIYHVQKAHKKLWSLFLDEDRTEYPFCFFIIEVFELMKFMYTGKDPEPKTPDEKSLDIQFEGVKDEND